MVARQKHSKQRTAGGCGKGQAERLQPPAANMRLLVGDDTGLVKVLQCPRAGDALGVYAKYGAQSRARGVCRMCWAGDQPFLGGASSEAWPGPCAAGLAPPVAEKQVLVAYRDGSCDLQDVLTGLTSTCRLRTQGKGEVNIVGLEVLHESTHSGYTGPLRVAAGTRDGLFTLLAFEGGPVAGGAEKEPSVVAEWRLGADTRICKVVPGMPARLLSGGKEELLKVWDLETKECVFAAENVPDDWLDLRVPVWINDAVVLPATQTEHGTVR
eukprot:g66906.t1